MDQHLIDLISKTPFLGAGDKNFLIQRLNNLSPLEKLKLQQSLTHGQAPAILQSLQIMRAKFFESEKPSDTKEPNFVDKIAGAILPKKEKTPVSTSVLNQPQILGAPSPQAITGESVKPLENLLDFYHPAQLQQLTSKHISFGLNDNQEQIIQDFTKNLTKAFDKVTDLNIKRSYFMNFMLSPLFVSYINTGLTALRHPELQPNKIVLDLLYQINTNYLNNKQFANTALITNHLREQCCV